MFLCIIEIQVIEQLFIEFGFCIRDANASTPHQSLRDSFSSRRSLEKLYEFINLHQIIQV